MKKADLVAALQRYADEGRGRMKGQSTLARFLAYYFDQLEIPADEQWKFWRIEGHLPQLLLGGLEEFRTSSKLVVGLLISGPKLRLFEMMMGSIWVNN